LVEVDIGKKKRKFRVALVRRGEKDLKDDSERNPIKRETSTSCKGGKKNNSKKNSRAANGQWEDKKKTSFIARYKILQARAMAQCLASPSSLCSRVAKIIKGEGTIWARSNVKFWGYWQ